MKIHLESKGKNTAYRVKQWILLLMVSLLINCHSKYSTVTCGTSLVVQVRLHTPGAGSSGSIPVQGTRHCYSDVHFNKHNINPKNDSLIVESQLPLLSG